MTCHRKGRKASYGKAVVLRAADREEDVGCLAEAIEWGAGSAELVQLFDEAGAVPGGRRLAGERKEGVPFVEEAVDNAVHACAGWWSHCRVCRVTAGWTWGFRCRCAAVVTPVAEIVRGSRGGFVELCFQNAGDTSGLSVRCKGERRCRKEIELTLRCCE